MSFLSVIPVIVAVAQVTPPNPAHALPDLVVEALSIEGPDNRIIVGVANVGIANVPPDRGKLSVFVDEVRVLDIPFSDMGAENFLLATGRTAVDTGVYLSGTAGSRRLMIIVDPDDEVTELDEIHNNLSVQWDPPPRIGYDLKLTAGVDHTERLYLHVENVGTTWAPRQAVEAITLSVAGGDWVEVLPDMPTLGPGHSTVIELPEAILITQPTTVRAVLLPADRNGDIDNSNDVYEEEVHYVDLEDIDSIYGPLLEDPLIGGAMRWLDHPDAFGYSEWPADLQDRLKAHLLTLELGRDPMPPHPPTLDDAGLWSQDDMAAVYTGLVAQSLWFEVHGQTAWSLHDLAADDLALLLDMQHMGFTRSAERYRVSTWHGGSITPWNSRRLYKTIANLGLLRDTQRDTAAALADWMSHVRHSVNEEASSAAKSHLEHYGYPGLVPADLIIYPLHTGLSEHVAYKGCWTRTGFFKAALQGVNIPVHNGKSQLYPPGTHSRIELPTIRKTPEDPPGIAIIHSDDIGMNHGLDLFLTFAEIQDYIDDPLELYCDDEGQCLTPAQQASFNKKRLEHSAGTAWLWPNYVIRRADGVQEVSNFLRGTQPVPYLSEQEISEFLGRAADVLLEVGSGDIHLGADRLQHKGAQPPLAEFYEVVLEIPPDYGTAPTMPLVDIHHPHGFGMITQHIAEPRPLFEATFHEPGDVTIDADTFTATLFYNDEWSIHVEDITELFSWSASAATYQPAEDLPLGSHMLVIEIANVAGGVGKNTSRFDIEPTLEITTTELPGAVVGSPLAQQLQGQGGRPDYHWSVATGALPKGLALSTSGLLAGTPTEAGLCEFTAQLCDSDYNCTATPLSMSVFPAIKEDGGEDHASEQAGHVDAFESEDPGMLDSEPPG